MTRPQKRQRLQGRAAGVGKAQVLSGPPDSKLVQLLVNAMSLPAGSAQIVGSAYVVTQETWLYGQAMAERCKELGGDSDAHIERAYRAIVGRQ